MTTLLSRRASLTFSGPMRICMGASPAGTGRFCLLSTMKAIRSWALSTSRYSGNFSSWLAPLVKTSCRPLFASSPPAYSTVWFSSRNRWPSTWSLRLMSRVFISAGPIWVKWVFSRWLSSGSRSWLTGSSRCIS